MNIPKTSWLRADDHLLSEFDLAKLNRLSAPKWIKKLENVAAACSWDNKTLLFYAVSKLKGAAIYWYDSLEMDLSYRGDFSG